MAKAAYYEERANTSFIGYFLIGFVLLLLGVIGLQNGNLFGDDLMKWPVNDFVFKGICFVVGLVLLILTVFAYRTGEKTSAAVFAIFATVLFAINTDWFAETGNSDWFLYVALAVLLLIVAVYAFLEEDSSKLVAVMLIVLVIMFFFMAMANFFDPNPNVLGPGNDANLCHTMNMVSGIVSIIGFALATYIGLAHSQPDKLPLI